MFLQEKWKKKGLYFNFTAKHLGCWDISVYFTEGLKCMT